MNKGFIKERVLNMLNRAPNNQPWRSAARITSKLETYFSDVSIIEVQDLLFEMEHDDKTVRRSLLPSKKTLDILWGSLEKVKDKEVMPSYKLDGAKNFLLKEVKNLKEPYKVAFISHSHQDHMAIGLAKNLLNLDIYPWMAETEINEGHLINDEIKKGIEMSDYFLMYLTTKALESRWVLKEIKTSLTSFWIEKIPIVVMDRDAAVTFDERMSLDQTKGVIKNQDLLFSLESYFSEHRKIYVYPSVEPHNLNLKHFERVDISELVCS